MKKVLSIVLAVMMLASICAISASAGEAARYPTTRVNVASFATAYGTNSATKNGKTYPILTDGELGNNSTATDFCINAGFADKGTATNTDCTFSHRGGITTNTTPAKAKLDYTLAGNTYYYYIDVKLSAASTVDGFCFYLKGYKQAAMDHGFDILYSTDNGATWTKLVGTTNPFSTSSDIYYSNFDAAAPWDGNAYGAATKATTIETPAYVAYELETPIEGVTDIAYACTETRCNNGYYMSFFTEFEVYSRDIDFAGLARKVNVGADLDTARVGEVREGYDPIGDSKLIETEEDFLTMKADGNYCLANDITIDNTYATKFTGTFDGCGHTVTLSVPMFAEFAGTAKNFRIYGDINIDNGSNYGAAVAVKTSAGTATFENIANFAPIYKGDASGALVGYGADKSNIVIKNCYNDAPISGDNQIGAFVGYEQGYTLTIDNCVNSVNGTIESTGNYCGGLVGRFGKDASTVNYICKISNCTNYADVTAAKSQVGGVIGYTVGLIYIDDCSNYGDITNKSGASGGIFGAASGKEINNVLIKNCYNFGTVVATTGYAGGIAAKSGTVKPATGYAYRYVACVNFGDVIRNGASTSTDGASGIVGYCWGGSEGNGCFYCINVGNVKYISSKANTARAICSGIIGYANSNGHYVKGCINVGKLAMSVTGGTAANTIMCDLDFNLAGSGITGTGADATYMSGNFVREFAKTGLALTDATKIDAAYEANGQMALTKPSYTVVTDYELYDMINNQIGAENFLAEIGADEIIPGGTLAYDTTPDTGDVITYVVIALAVSVLSIAAIVIVRKKENN